MKVVSVWSGDGTSEADVLRLAATAFRELADERTRALASACATNQLTLLNLKPRYRGRRRHHAAPRGKDHLRSSAKPAGTAGAIAAPLEIISDGQLAGIIGFGPTPDPEAAAAIKELHCMASSQSACCRIRPMRLPDLWRRRWESTFMVPDLQATPSSR